MIAWTSITSNNAYYYCSKAKLFMEKGLATALGPVGPPDTYMLEHATSARGATEHLLPVTEVGERSIPRGGRRVSIMRLPVNNIINY